jgi:hypothetical protein
MAVKITAQSPPGLSIPQASRVLPLERWRLTTPAVSGVKIPILKAILVHYGFIFCAFWPAPAQSRRRLQPPGRPLAPHCPRDCPRLRLPRRRLGLRRIVALYYHQSTSYPIFYHIRYLSVGNDNVTEPYRRRPVCASAAGPRSARTWGTLLVRLVWLPLAYPGGKETASEHR